MGFRIRNGVWGAVVVAILLAGCSAAPAAPTPAATSTTSAPTTSPTEQPASPSPSATSASGQATTPPAGPPFQGQQPGISVYDYAGIFSPETEAKASSTIDSIKQGAGVPVYVYTQFKPDATKAKTEVDAIGLASDWQLNLLDPWVIILFNMTTQTCQAGVPGNGQVQLYGSPAYDDAYLSTAQRQEIFDKDMAPLLSQCHYDDGLLAGINAIAAGTLAASSPSATP